MASSEIERRIGSIEHLADLSIEELTELCFAQQRPDLAILDVPYSGYIPTEAPLNFDSFVNNIEAQRQYTYLRNDVEYMHILGKMMNRRKLDKRKTAATLPEGAMPARTAFREFKSCFDPITGEYIGSGPEGYLRVSDHVLVVEIDGQLIPVVGSESRCYTLELPEYIEDAEGIKHRKRKIHFEAAYPPEKSPYDYYDDRPTFYDERQIPYEDITEQELKDLLITHGKLDRFVQLELAV